MLPIGIARRAFKPKLPKRPPRKIAPPRPIHRPTRPPTIRHPPKPPTIHRPIPRPSIKAPRAPKIKLPKIRTPKIKPPKTSIRTLKSMPKIRMPEIPKIRIPKLRKTPKTTKLRGNEPKVSKWDKANAVIGALGIAATGAELYMMSKWMGDPGSEDTYGEDYGYDDMGYGYGYGDVGYGDMGYGYGDVGYGSGYLDSLSGAVSDSALDPSGDIENGTLEPTDDGGFVDENGNYYIPDPETGELINPETGQPYIPKTTKYALIAGVLILILIIGVVVHKKLKK